MVKNKKVKKVGPIRFGALFFIAILMAASILYTIFLLDVHLKWVAQKVLTTMNGSEVNIASLKTDLAAPSIRFEKIEISNPNLLERNRVEVGEVQFELLWDALLRAKIVINNISVKKITYNTKRDHVAFKVPEPTAEEQAQTQEYINKAKQMGMQIVDENVQDTFFENLASLGKGGDLEGELQKIRGELQFEKRVAETKAQLESDVAQSKQFIESNSSREDFKDIEDKINKIAKSKISKPNDVKKVIDQLKEVKKEIKTRANNIKNFGNDTMTRVNDFPKKLKELETTFNNDLDHLADKASMPGLDLNQIGENLFQKYVFDKYLVEYWPYYEKVKPYLPEKRTEDEKEEMKPRPIPRARGVDYTYGRVNSYPLFWMKKLEVTEFDNDSKFALGLYHVTTDQRSINHSTHASWMIENNSSNIPLLVTGKCDLDLRQKNIKFIFDTNVSGYPIKELKFFKAKANSLFLDSAQGTTQLNAKIDGEQIDLLVANDFTNAKLNFESSNETVQKFMRNVVAGVDHLTLNLQVTDKITSPKFAISTNFAQEMSNGIKKEFDQQLALFKEQMKKRVQAEIDQKKKELLAELENRKGELKTMLDGKKAELLQKLNLKDKLADKKIDELSKGKLKDLEGLLKKKLKL